MFSIVLLSLAGLATVQGYYTGTSHVSYSSPYVSFAYGSDHGRAFGGYRRVSAPGLVRSLAPAPASLVQLPAAYASLPALPNNLGGAALASDTLAKAALTYISDTGLDTCGQLSKAYIDVATKGGSIQEAAAAAAQIYRNNYWRGGLSRAAASPACRAAEAAFKQSFYAGGNAVLAAALAYMNAQPSDSACFQASKKYIEAVAAGVSTAEATKASRNTFAKQISSLTSQGKSTFDPACAQAARVYASSGAPGPLQDALVAFLDASILNSDGGVDPVCAAAAQSYFDATLAGDSDEAASEKAATAYLSALDSNPGFSSDSPCGQAAEAYIAASRK